MTAIGYLRHTQKSGPGPEGLAEQAARIRAHCEGRGWALAEVVTEERSWWRQGLVGLVDLGQSSRSESAGTVGGDVGGGPGRTGGGDLSDMGTGPGVVPGARGPGGGRGQQLMSLREVVLAAIQVAPGSLPRDRTLLHADLHPVYVLPR
jgi:hypothetical protein